MCRSSSLVHAGEEHVADRRDGGLEAEVDSVLDGLGAHDSALLGEHLESTETARGLVVLNALQELAVNDDLARDVVGALAPEPDHLVDDHLTVVGHGVVDHRLDEVLVGLSAADEDLAFHELDESLRGLEQRHLPG